ncbi:MAG: Fis family transcriptional regulator [Neisseria sp.]|nr:Fis family transcriptional regulator [Neisseria sp.]
MSEQVMDIAQCVEQTLNEYFKTLDGEPAHDVYAMVLQQVEKPMLQVVMKQCRHNQSKAAAVLGLNRNTLRKKLQEHQLLHTYGDKTA